MLLDVLLPGCKDRPEPYLAAHHILVGLGGTLQRKHFSHGPHACEQAEGKCILRIDGGTGRPTQRSIDAPI